MTRLYGYGRHKRAKIADRSCLYTINAQDWVYPRVAVIFDKRYLREHCIWRPKKECKLTPFNDLSKYDKFTWLWKTSNDQNRIKKFPI